jgi:ribosomal protein S18 acetylase RimI-like enzyme
VQLDRHSDRLYLGMLTVEPGLQGVGLGKQLLKAAEDAARIQSCQSIFMTVISQRHELLEWYKRHGYQDTGKRKPFVAADVRFGIPKKELEFVILEKSLR